MLLHARVSEVIQGKEKNETSVSDTRSVLDERARKHLRLTFRTKELGRGMVQQLIGYLIQGQNQRLDAFALHLHGFLFKKWHHLEIRALSQNPSNLL